MSTSIETNTEELQEILNTVYDLPDRSTGGSSDADLVVTFTANEGDNYLSPDSVIESNFAIGSGSVETVWQKLRNNERVNVILLHYYEYASSTFIGTFYPTLVTSDLDSEDSTKRLSMMFLVNGVPGYSGAFGVIELCLLMDGTINNAHLRWIQERS